MIPTFCDPAKNCTENRADRLAYIAKRAAAEPLVDKIAAKLFDCSGEGDYENMRWEELPDSVTCAPNQIPPANKARWRWQAIHVLDVIAHEVAKPLDMMKNAAPLINALVKAREVFYGGARGAPLVSRKPVDLDLPRAIKRIDKIGRY